MPARRTAPLVAALALLSSGLAVGLGSTSGATALPAGTTSARAAAPLVVSVVSNRPDLVSGGDARVAVALPAEVAPRSVRVELNGRNVTAGFARRPSGLFEALLTRLKLGRNVVVAKSGQHSGRLVITNHPNGGPIFSGPHPTYYRCQESARDKLCNEPAKYRYLYRSTNPLRSSLQPYNPKSPPSDLATTTTDTGETLPFIVRAETGYQDRDRYTILTLWQPGKTWSRFAPQPQFNHKLLFTHGGGCGASYTPADPPLADFSGTFPEETPGITQSYITALGLGFAVASTALANTGHNCNVAKNAESLLMVKERFVEQYGTLRYTMGTGCSGGSIVQHTVANAYPGIYQGLITTCSYPDTFTAGAQFADYHLMRLYFENPARWAPGVVWLPTQMADVEGHATILNSIVADVGLYQAALDPENDCSGTQPTKRGNPKTRYNARTNPTGVRCSVLDLLINPLGPRPKSVWTSQEKAAGRGFGGIPFANTGVQYGLKALKAGRITTAQFVDLNAKLGGLSVDSTPIPERTQGDSASIANAYRTGLINEANHLDEVAIINFGGPDPGIAHDYAHAFWTEDRLMRDQGHTDNRVMWFGVAPLIGDLRWANEGLVEMDRWLSAVEKDRSNAPLARKVVTNKPADLTDRCDNVPGVLQVPGEDDEVDCILPETAQLRLSTPRQEAGGTRLNDVVACQLKPLVRSDYDFLLLPLTDTQWATLQKVFPGGVCANGKRGRGQGPSQTWLDLRRPRRRRRLRRPQPAAHHPTPGRGLVVTRLRRGPHQVATPPSRRICTRISAPVGASDAPTRRKGSLRVATERVGELVAATDAELAERRGEVVVDGAHRESGALGDLPAAPAISSQGGDLELTSGQTSANRGRRPARS